jgi:type IV pilus assembly protein PilM
MPAAQTAVGIDIGAHALKAVVLRKKGSHLSVARAGSVELGDLAFIEDSERKDRRLAELLRMLLRQTRIRRSDVGSGLAGHDCFVKYLHVPPAPPDKLRKLIEYEVSEDPAAGAHEHSSDFWLLDLPTKAEEFTILVAMARNEILRRRISLIKNAGLSCDGLTLNAVAFFDAYVQSLDEDIYNDKTTLLVDLGARHMDVVVQRNAKLLFVRNLSLGGNQFSEAVQEEFQLPIREAEELKLAQGALLPRHFDVAADIDVATPEARLSAALLDGAEQVYDTLQATIRYCQAQTRMRDLRIDEIVLGGRAVQLTGLREFLSHRFHVPVEVIDPFRGIETSTIPLRYRDEVVDDAPGYAVAMGLALRQFTEPRRRTITLLPDEYRRRREFLARDAFLYAAAAVFALAFGTMVYTSGAATREAAITVQDRVRRVKSAQKIVERFQGHMKHNAILDGQAEALQRLLDTGRRCDETITILTNNVPEQLKLDDIETITDRPSTGPRQQGAPLTTRLHIRGRVAETYKDQPISEGGAQAIINECMDMLRAHKHLYSDAKVTRYPKPDESRAFEIVLTFSDPFYGSVQEVRRKKR